MAASGHPGSRKAPGGTPAGGPARRTRLLWLICIGLISERVRPYYEERGLTEYEFGKAAPDLTAADLINDVVPAKASA